MIPIVTKIECSVASDTSHSSINSKEFVVNFLSYQQNSYKCPYPAML